MKAQGMTWPNWNDGDPGEGPIVNAYHVRVYPTIIVIDAKGVIRSPNVLGSDQDQRRRGADQRGGDTRGGQVD